MASIEVDCHSWSVFRLQIIHKWKSYRHLIARGSSRRSMQLRLSTLERQEQPNMKKRADRRPLRLSGVSAGGSHVFIACVFPRAGTPCFSYEWGQPDPAGLASRRPTKHADDPRESFCGGQ